MAVGPFAFYTLLDCGSQATGAAFSKPPLEGQVFPRSMGLPSSRESRVQSLRAGAGRGTASGPGGRMKAGLGAKPTTRPARLPFCFRNERLMPALPCRANEPRPPHSESRSCQPGLCSGPSVSTSRARRAYTLAESTTWSLAAVSSCRRARWRHGCARPRIHRSTARRCPPNPSRRMGSRL
jgi:hypothetical protein